MTHPLSSPADLLALAERVEKAEGPDRALDALIAVILKIGARGMLPDDFEYLTAVKPDDYCTLGTYWFHCRSGMSLRTADPFTASLDAAMTLVPEGWDWGIAHFGVRGSEAQAWPHGARDSTQKTAGSSDTTPAQALAAAALKARALSHKDTIS